MTTAAFPLFNRVDANLKRELDATTAELGLSFTGALTVLILTFQAMRRGIIA